MINKNKRRIIKETGKGKENVSHFEPSQLKLTICVMTPKKELGVMGANKSVKVRYIVSNNKEGNFVCLKIITNKKITGMIVMI